MTISTKKERTDDDDDNDDADDADNFVLLAVLVPLPVVFDAVVGADDFMMESFMVCVYCDVTVYFVFVFVFMVSRSDVEDGITLLSASEYVCEQCKWCIDKFCWSTNK